MNSLLTLMAFFVLLLTSKLPFPFTSKFPFTWSALMSLKSLLIKFLLPSINVIIKLDFLFLFSSAIPSLEKIEALNKKYEID